MRTPLPERKYRRFNLRYPVRVTLQSGECVSQIEAMSRNVSIGGLLLETHSLIPEHSQVSFVMTIAGPPVPHPVELVGEGSVVRVERTPETVRVAVECKTPIAHIERYFPQPA
jgi:PilZ domain